MKITISSHGTRGDVQPYLALAVGLQNSGHQVTLATSYNYTDWIHSYGVGTHPTRFSLQAFMQGPEWQEARQGGKFLKQFRLFKSALQMYAENMDDVWDAVREADFVIQSPASSGALEAYELYGTPAALAYPVPFAPTREFPSYFLGPARFSLGAAYNRLTHTFMHRLLWGNMTGPMTDQIRKKQGLPPVRSFSQQLAFARKNRILSLYGFSEHVLPKPADWDELQHVTGYWFLDSPTDWQPEPDLVQFLENGPPPVYVGFGSMDAMDTAAITAKVLEALKISGQRGVILTGWGGLERLPATSDIFFIENVPHDWLFPRMAALVHHGGAGTTGAGLRAGVPNIITPVGADQFAWAERVVALGVGPSAPALKRLSVEKLAGAIRTAVDDPSIRVRAAALGKQIQAENGIARAVDIINQHETPGGNG